METVMDLAPMPPLDVWDYAFFGCLFTGVLCGLSLLVIILGLPGKIAVARNHPDAEAVHLMGWVGFLAVIPWIQALIWAFKPTDKIDIRRYPEAEAAATEEMIAKMRDDMKGGLRRRKPVAEVAEADVAPGDQA